MTKAQANEARAEAIAKLHTLLKPGDIVSTVVRHVARSGMQRSITLMIVHDGETESIDCWVAHALRLTIDRTNGGIKIGGAGMDMGFQLVYLLGQAMWPEGTPKPHGRRNGQPDRAGGYALKHRWL